MKSREPIFNFSEPAPVQFAGLLILLHPLLHYTPLSRHAGIGNLVILRPAELTQGWGWLSAGGHAFAHTTWVHVFTNAIMLIIFAILTMRGARGWAIRQGKSARPILTYIGIFLIGVIGGAFTQWAWWAGLSVINGMDAIVAQSAIGASGGVSALFASGAWAMGGRNTLVKFGIGWALINAMFVAFESVLGFGLAWPAHMGGYLAGALFAPLCVAAGITGFDPRN